MVFTLRTVFFPWPPLNQRGQRYNIRKLETEAGVSSLYQWLLAVHLFLISRVTCWPWVERSGRNGCTPSFDFRWANLISRATWNGCIRGFRLAKNIDGTSDNVLNPMITILSVTINGWCTSSQMVGSVGYTTWIPFVFPHRRRSEPASVSFAHCQRTPKKISGWSETSKVQHASREEGGTPTHSTNSNNMYF